MLFGIIASANAYVERDLLQKAADIPELKSVLLMDRQWVPYPDYTDRNFWEITGMITSNKEKNVWIMNGKL